MVNLIETLEVIDQLFGNEVKTEIQAIISRRRLTSADVLLMRNLRKKRDLRVISPLG